MPRLAMATILFVAAAAGGCVHEFAYLPVDNAGGGPASRYAIPPEAPRGEVYVTSFGFTQMDVAQGRTADMMHARVVAVNNGPDAWTVDGRAQQLLVGPAQPPLTPAYINTDAGAPGPVYAVPPGQHRVFDFYYPLSPPLNQPQQLGGFALDWRVDVGGRPIAQRTPFQRFEGGGGAYEPYPSYVYVGLGWGPGWWYGPGPFYPYGYRPVVRTYYYPPSHARAYGTWRGTPRTVPPGGGGWRGTPPSGRGAPAPRGGGWRGSPR